MHRFKLIITTLVIASLSQTINAQERVIISTDRDIYIGGETIWFTASAIYGDNNQLSDLSKVIYLELINRNNNPVIQEKFNLMNGQVSSKIELPDSLPTDNYKLRAYTKWMSNFSELMFERKILTVINPFSKSVLVKKGGNKIPKIQHNNTNDNSFEIKLNETIFKQRDLVEFSFVNTTQQPIININTTVTKNSLLGTDNSSRFHSNLDTIKTDIKYPECKGEILCGTMLNSNTGDVIKHEKIMLSFVSKEPTLQFATTDSLGKFHFVINRSQEEEMVIQPLSNDTSKLNYKILLDDTFSNKYVNNEIPSLHIDSAKIEGINEAIINMQINTLYSTHLPETIFQDTIEQHEVFYGKPLVVTRIDKFIDLPSIGEVTQELVPFVGTRKKDGKRYFKIFEDSYVNQTFDEPFVLVDGIPIKELKYVFELPPNTIDRIELINLNYFVAAENIGPILSFYTKHTDMAQMNFDSRIFRQVHKGYSLNYKYIGYDYSLEKNKQSKSADFRNLLYYKSTFQLESNTSKQCKFYTCDEQTEYTIKVCGINYLGEKVSTTKTFTVE